MITQIQSSRRFFLLALAGLFLLAAPFIGAARPGRGEDHFGRGRGHAERGLHGPMHGLRLMLENMDLSAGQETAARGIMDAHRSRLEDLGFDLLEAHKLLDKSIRQPVTDTAAVKAACARQAEVDKQLELERGGVWAGIYPLLTPDQQTRMKGKLAGLETGIERFHRGRQTGKSDRGDRRGRHPGLRLPGHLFGRVDLSDAQKDQIRTILEERAPAMKSLVQADRDGHARLRAVIAAPAVDTAAIEQACLVHAQAHEGLALQRAGIHAAVWALLTDTQKARLEHRQERIQRLRKL